VLLGIPEDQLAPRLEALPAALGIPWGEALLVVTEAPQFLLMKADTMVEGWQELLRAARLRPKWREQIGNWAVRTIARCAPHSASTVCSASWQSCTICCAHLH
jgi:hypothetical protein